MVPDQQQSIIRVAHGSTELAVNRSLERGKSLQLGGENEQNSRPVHTNSRKREVRVTNEQKKGVEHSPLRQLPMPLQLADAVVCRILREVIGRYLLEL